MHFLVPNALSGLGLSYVSARKTSYAALVSTLSLIECEVIVPHLLSINPIVYSSNPNQERPNCEIYNILPSSRIRMTSIQELTK